MSDLRFAGEATGISDRLTAFDEGEPPGEPERSVAFDRSEGWTTLLVRVGNVDAELVVRSKSLGARWLRPTARDLVKHLFAAELDADTRARLEAEIPRALDLLADAAASDLPAPEIRMTADGGLDLIWKRQGHRLEVRLDPGAKPMVYLDEPGVAATLRPTGDREGSVDLGRLLERFRPARAMTFIMGLADPAVGEPLVSEATALRARTLLHQVSSRLPQLFTPVVGPGPDGVLGMTWETDAHHFNLEVFPDGHLEVFHEDLTTGALWGAESRRDLPSEFVARLSQATSEA